MIKRIVFFVVSNFNLRDYRRFGIELLRENGFRVEVWDMTPVLNPVLHQNYIPIDPVSVDDKDLTVFNDQREMIDRILNLGKSDFVINLLTYCSKNLSCFRALSKSKVDYAVCVANAILSSGESMKDEKLSKVEKIKKFILSLPAKIYNFICSISSRKTWPMLFQKIPFRLLGIKPAKLILAGGERSMKYNYPRDKNTKLLWVHSFDYDFYLQEQKKPVTTRPRAVFIDEYAPFHTDFEVYGMKSPVNAERYYSLLNKFFSLLENHLGSRVVIAAHPRSQYEKCGDCFSGRECIRGQTAKLVKESSLVLAHHSTALNFANLYHKPVIFLTDSEFVMIPEGPDIPTIAHWFGKKPIWLHDNPNVNLNINWEEELLVSAKHYQCYRRAYIKTEKSEDLPFWQIVANRLKKWE